MSAASSSLFSSSSRYTAGEGSGVGAGPGPGPGAGPGGARSLALSELGTASAIKRDFDAYLNAPLPSPSSAGSPSASLRSSTLTADLEAHVVQALRQNEEVSHELEQLLREVSTPIKPRAETQGSPVADSETQTPDPTAPHSELTSPPRSSTKRALEPAMAAAAATEPASPARSQPVPQLVTPPSQVKAASDAVARANADLDALRASALESEADATLSYSTALNMARARYGGMSTAEAAASAAASPLRRAAVASNDGNDDEEARLAVPRIPPSNSPLRDHFSNISSFLAESTSSRRDADASLMSSIVPLDALVQAADAVLHPGCATRQWASAAGAQSSPRPQLSPSRASSRSPRIVQLADDTDDTFDADHVNAALLQAGMEPVSRRSSKRALASVLLAVLRQLEHRGRVVSEQLAAQQAAANSAEAANSDMVRMRRELLAASKAKAALELKLAEAEAAGDEAAAAAKRETRKLKAALSSLTSQTHVMRSKLAAKDEELSKVKAKLLKVVEVSGTPVTRAAHAGGAASGMVMRQSLAEKERARLESLNDAQRHELRLVQEELRELRAQVTAKAETEYAKAFEAGFKAGQANDPLRASLERQLAEASGEAADARKHATAAEGAARAAVEARDAAYARIKSLEDELELAKLELEARPSVLRWREEREAAAEAPALTAGMAADSGLSFVVGRDGNNASRTRELIRQDRESFSLAHHSLDSLSGSQAREALQTVLDRLGVPSLRKLESALAKIERAMAALPGMQEFIESVLAAIRSGKRGVAVGVGNALGVLASWRTELDEARAFRTGAADAFGLPSISLTELRTLAAGLRATSTSREVPEAKALEARVELVARLEALLGVTTPEAVLNEVVALSQKVDTYESALPEYVVLVDALFDMLDVETLGDVMPALRHALGA
ncbi:uncharacterized protein AMSG_08802 [Thecamonas trahens ATCC 50062]|uniref:Centrosomal protein of 70 kDa n=1 Tax=Thecamonas trahens ATCC 50062 TaxID=461836 RepID=A0A0L0DPF8_THETB|nr:hypothetical protein AMSG_08802 [Thecamonas trahens ATCC 50062]KNC53308.1 hypothetical protein AMSG_08802 [Thecamonas trahens ATCC 50062]|eukprot:XP_013754569.1 hypothetical protein AMSG_08802 [Thecamonas trahens ATCC 50062]